MQRSTKTLLCFILSLSMIFCLFAGCKSKSSKPLRLCVDLEKGVQFSKMAEPAVKGFLETVADLGGPEDVEVEYIPAPGEERQNVLQRLRSEIMAGEGPDVFILMSGHDNPNVGEDDPLFLLPEKAMESGRFLPLDPYLENAKFMEWEKLTPVVMEAGKTEEGQMLLPLCYTFPVTLYPKEEVDISTPKSTTWADMTSDDTGLLSAVTTDWYKIENNFFIITDSWSLFPAALFGTEADYRAEQLTFTEEELLTYTKQAVALYQKGENGEFASLPKHKTITMAVDQCQGVPYTMIPCYQAEGGVTATVTAFAGINANTARPEDAFFLLDVLFKADVQEKSNIYRYFSVENGVPTYEGLMTQEHPAKDGWYLSESNYQEFSRIRDQITTARFSTVIDFELADMLHDCCGTPGEAPPTTEEVEEIVSETYRKLKLYLNES